MLSGDEQTLKAVRELARACRGSRPIVLWVGAGVSANGGIPSWPQLAELMHQEFKRSQTGYVASPFSVASTTGDFPTLFSYCKALDPQRYNRVIISALTGFRESGAFLRLISQLKAIAPLRVVTTNADELLESKVGFRHVVQNSDIERVSSLISANESFICKLHGSVSAIQSIVFTTDEYQEATSNATLLRELETLFSVATVIFIGYSLQDAYILDLLQRNVDQSTFFGAGPHFLVTSSYKNGLPASIRQISYPTHESVGHRGFLTALDVVIANSTPNQPEDTRSPTASKFYLPDFIDIGTWQSSQTLAFNDHSGTAAGIAVVGTGFVDAEVSSLRPLGLHNLVVGLVCYEKVVLPVDSMGNFHRVLGAEYFFRLVRSGAIEFAWVPCQVALIFAQQDLVANGGLVCLTIMNRDIGNEAESFESAIARQIQIISASRSEIDRTLDELRSVCVEVSSSVIDNALLDARGALIMPNVRNELGMGDGILPTHIPKWFVFPALRIAHLMKDAAIASHLGAAATQLPFGTYGLANAAFSMQSQPSNAGDIASYVVAGDYGIDLGQIVASNPAVLDSILAFRDTQVGVDARREVFQCTGSNPGHELSSAVDGALAKGFPTQLLQTTRRKFATLFAAKGRASIWTSQMNSASDFRLWRRRSATILREVIGANPPNYYSACPCGSGDQLKFCCGPLLKEL